MRTPRASIVPSLTTPNEGVNDGVEFDATESFLSRWQDADDELSGTDEGKNAQAPNGDEDDATDLELLSEIEREDGADDAEGETDQNEGEADGDEAGNVPEAGDDHVVSITVDGETQTVSVKDLKRLYGQEASLTRKSQEVAAARKVADAEGERYMLAAQKLIEKAEERFAPFAKIDWMVAQQRLNADEFAALREEARSAYQDLQFLNAETEEVLTRAQQERQAQAAQTAKETIAVLERDIPGWNQEVYNGVRKFAVESGMAPEVVNSIVDAAPLKILHMAMKYSELKAKAASKKTTPKAAPKKVVGPSSARSKQADPSSGRKTEALKALQKTGRTEDAVNAFMSAWADQSSDS